MPRFLLKQGEVVRRLATVDVAHDGSIKLVLVRGGTSETGFTWSEGPEGRTPLLERGGEAKSKSITIHTSGRVNYHFNGGASIYLPCLLDLPQAFPVIIYSIPSIGRLDSYSGQGKDNCVVDVPPELAGRLSFSFEVVPAVHESLPHEIGRLGIEGLYALVLRCIPNPATPPEVPSEVFTTYHPQTVLKEQATPEADAYLRFRKTMYAADVIAAAENAPNRDEITAAHIEAMIQAGPGIYPPNSEGIWTCLTKVPMRVAPRFQVEFEDARYRADVVDLKPADTRLQTVRVRFKVFDTKRSAYIKEHVAIRSYELNAEM